MAGNENSGGNQPDSPQNNFGVSATGGAGSKDGQPNMYIPDMKSLGSTGVETMAQQGGVYIDLRGMSGELGIPVWTASQTNRSAIDSEVIEADKIADSYAKVMNADFIMSLSRKAKDKCFWY